MFKCVETDRGVLKMALGEDSSCKAKNELMGGRSEKKKTTSVETVIRNGTNTSYQVQMGGNRAWRDENGPS